MTPWPAPQRDELARVLTIPAGVDMVEPDGTIPLNDDTLPPGPLVEKIRAGLDRLKARNGRGIA